MKSCIKCLCPDKADSALGANLLSDDDWLQEIEEKLVTFQVTFQPGALGFEPKVDTVTKIEKGGQAQRCGVKEGDVIKAVGNVECKTFLDQPFLDARVARIPYQVTFETKEKFSARCKARLDEVLLETRDPNVIDVPKNLQHLCGTDKILKPEWLTPNHIFLLFHSVAVFVAIYGILWSGLSMHYRQVLDGPLWAPLKLLKLGYPMVPVILGCWIARYLHDCSIRTRMTAGYYFANLKMSLMVSLGPGLLIGAVGKLVVLKLLGVELMLGTAYSEFLLPFAWLLGCLMFFFVKGLFYIGCGDKHEQTERCRKSWGFYARWVVDFDPEKPWTEWIRQGPHWLFGVIPASRHGTFHKIGAAAKLRCVGVTVCCAIAWFMMILVGLRVPDITAAFEELDIAGSAIAMLIHTDGPNLITNTLTAPMLIYATWRPEPKGVKEELCDGYAWVIYDDEEAERKQVLQKVAELASTQKQSAQV